VDGQRARRAAADTRPRLHGLEPGWRAQGQRFARNQDFTELHNNAVTELAFGQRSRGGYEVLTEQGGRLVFEPLNRRGAAADQLWTWAPGTSADSWSFKNAGTGQYLAGEAEFEYRESPRTSLMHPAWTGRGRVAGMSSQRDAEGAARSWDGSSDRDGQREQATHRPGESVKLPRGPRRPRPLCSRPSGRSTRSPTRSAAISRGIHRLRVSRYRAPGLVLRSAI